MLAFALSLLFSSVAEAQSLSSDELAREQFLNGRAAYDEGRYDDALAAFERAFELSPRPALHYNIGLAHDRLRHDADALEHYETYLREVENPPQQVQVEARIAALREAEARREAEQTARLDAERAAAEAAAQEAARAELEEQERRMAQLEAERDAARLEASEEESSNTGLIVGLSVGAAVVIGAVVAIVLVANSGEGDPSQSDFGSHSTALVRF